MNRSPIPHLTLNLAVFSGGMTTFAIELSAARLLGTVFGTSVIVWANIIGLILIYLSAGYFLGGWWADRSPSSRIFYRILIWGAFLTGLLPFAAKPVLGWAANMLQGNTHAVSVGSFLSILILFGLPVTLLGCISPFATRLALRSRERAGRVAGRLYALSTLGSILGAVLPVLLFIPAIGTTQTFLWFGIVLAIVACLGLAGQGSREVARFLWMPLILVLLSYIHNR